MPPTGDLRLRDAAAAGHAAVGGRRGLRLPRRCPAYPAGVDAARRAGVAVAAGVGAAPAVAPGRPAEPRLPRPARGAVGAAVAAGATPARHRRAGRVPRLTGRWDGRWEREARPVDRPQLLDHVLRRSSMSGTLEVWSRVRAFARVPRATPREVHAAERRQQLRWWESRGARGRTVAGG